MADISLNGSQFQRGHTSPRFQEANQLHGGFWCVAAHANPCTLFTSSNPSSPVLGHCAYAWVCMCRCRCTVCSYIRDVLLPSTSSCITGLVRMRGFAFSVPWMWLRNQGPKHQSTSKGEASFLVTDYLGGKRPVFTQEKGQKISDSSWCGMKTHFFHATVSCFVALMPLSAVMSFRVHNESFWRNEIPPPIVLELVTGNLSNPALFINASKVIDSSNTHAVFSFPVWNFQHCWTRHRSSELAAARYLVN